MKERKKENAVYVYKDKMLNGLSSVQLFLVLVDEYEQLASFSDVGIYSCPSSFPLSLLF